MDGASLLGAGLFGICLPVCYSLSGRESEKSMRCGQQEGKDHAVAKHWGLH